MKNILLLLILSLLPAQAMEVTFFNIGQGNCTLVTKPGQKTMLVDAGYSKAPLDDPSCKNVISEIIDTIKTKTPDKKLFVIASHADKDHINLLATICSSLLKDNFSIEFLLGGAPSFYIKKEAKELLAFLDNNKKTCKKTFSSDITGDDRAKQFSKLLPEYAKVLSAITTSENKLDPNDTSIVVKVRDHSFSTLLPGDATGNIMNPLIKTKLISLFSTIYELSHHGAETHETTTLPLLLGINPRIIIVSSGLYNGKLMHPRFESIKTAVEFCVKKNRIDAMPHLLTYQNTNGIPSYNGKTNEKRFNLVAVGDDGFCTAQTTCPIYHTADVGTITCTVEGVSASKITSTEEERGIALLKQIHSPRFDGIRLLLFNNMEIESTQLKTHFTALPKSLEYFDLRDNNIGHIGIEHLITLYKNHGKNLIIKLADNRLVDKKTLTTVCKKKDIRAITSKNRILLTFSKKNKVEDTVETIEFSSGDNDRVLVQHAQAKAYARDCSKESDEAGKNTLATPTDDGQEVVYELSHDTKNLYIEHSDQSQKGFSYEWPGITDICLLSDQDQTVAGITTKERSSLFDFVKNEFKNLTGRFRYTNSSKPWKTIGKEFWSLDEPGVNYYHERTPFSYNGKFVMTVSSVNKTLNIYEIDPLVFDPRHVKLHKTISEDELKNDLGHTIADIKRVAFTDNDHSVKVNFTDHTHGELRYILDPKAI
jgi:beta-lactamase superfamily II metal-dependent hydrolase